VRYARPRCEECVRLEADYEAVYLEYLSALDDLTLTPRSDNGYLEKSQHLDKITGQLRESRKRGQSHEHTHQDEFS
jgi:hypothetical protein